MPDAFPKLRDEIDAAPADRDGETYYILYDRAGVAQSRLLVSPLGLLVAGRLDGASSVLDVTDRLSRELGGNGVGCSEVESIVSALHEAMFLDDSRFHDYQSQIARDFRASTVRLPGSAGSAYDDDPERLAEALDRMLADAPPTEESTTGMARHPRGVVSPHLDFPRGSHGYGQIYRALADLPAPRTVVVVGTAHVPISGRYSLCAKDFATPLGEVRLDEELAERVRQALGGASGTDEDILAHRSEHSIELQAVWIRHVFGPETRIVPILAGSLGDWLEGGRDPAEAAAQPSVVKLAECLGNAAAGDALLMASADLSHVGPRFGDSREVTNHFLAEVEEADRDYLEAVAVGPVTGLESLASHADRYHVCGSAGIFAVGMALKSAEARLLGYHQAVTPEMRQAVTFAAMTLA